MSMWSIETLTLKAQQNRLRVFELMCLRKIKEVIHETLHGSKHNPVLIV